MHISYCIFEVNSFPPTKMFLTNCPVPLHKVSFLLVVTVDFTNTTEVLLNS